MKRNFLTLCAVVVLGIVIGCATQKMQVEAPVFQAHDLGRDVRSGAVLKKVDNYLIILDTSQSMRDPYKYKGYTKFTYAKELIRRMNDTLPDLEIQGALRTFGHGTCLPNAKTLSIYRMQDHRKDLLNDGLDKVQCDGGPSPLDDAIDAASDDLSVSLERKTAARIAVIILSDGIQMDDSPIESARNMSRRFGKPLCIYAIHVGESPVGRKYMERLANVTRCAPAVGADEISTGEKMAQFVESVFLQKATDTDGDGVYDHQDRCPNTPVGVKVDQTGCPLDRDCDGVLDYRDACPNTPRGVRVDARGCPSDMDGDGVPDYLDKCPGTPMGVSVDRGGCPVDSDNDGVADDKDSCPGTPAGVPVDKFGCSIDK
jgi:OOP family OmpA-OmpF porin